MTREFKLFLFLGFYGAGLLVGLKYLSPIFLPFLTGILLACLLEPLVRGVEKYFLLSRSPAVILVLVASLLVFLGLSVLLLIASWQEVERLWQNIPELTQRLLSWNQMWQCQFEQFFHLDTINLGFNLPPEEILRWVRSFLIQLMKGLSQFPRILLVICLTGITAYFFSRDKETITRFLLKLIPGSWQPAALQFKSEVLATVGRYLRVELGLAILTGILTMIFFGILRLPGAPAYGLLSGIMDLAPFVGAGIIFIPMALVNFLFHNFYTGFALLGGYFLMVLLRQFLEVKWIGFDFHFHPLITLAVIYAGLKICGLSGVFYGPLTLVILQALYQISARDVFTELS